MVEWRNMEQTTQQISQKPPLPIKTKIAAWWIMTILIVLTTAAIVLHDLAIYVPLTIISFILCIFILERKKWAWWIITLVLIGINFVVTGFVILNAIVTSFSYKFEFWLLNNGGAFLCCLPILIPLILFLLDRKNFFKIAS